MRFEMPKSVQTLLLACLLACAALAADTQPTPFPVPAQSAEVLAAKNRQLDIMRARNMAQVDYTLGPGDILKIDVMEDPQMGGEAQISQEGQILLPFVSSVKAAGLTTFELQKKLEELLAASVIKQPHVQVTVKEHRSQPVNVLGEVNKPGTYQLSHAMRLADILSLSGGFTKDASDHCTITRVLPDGTESRMEISLSKLLEHGDASLNVPMKANDIVHISKKVDRFFYVLGEVGKPGAYPFSDEKKSVRLTEALSSAGGCQKTAKLKSARLVRTKADGTKDTKVLDLAKVLDGRGEDVEILENDLIVVPSSTTKNFAYTMLSGAATILTAGIWALK